MSSSKPVLILLVLAAVSIPTRPVFPTAHSQAAAGPEQKEIRLVFSGDILLSRGVEHRLAGNPGLLASALRPILSGADWAAGNLEGAVGTPEECSASESNVPCFAIRSIYIPLLLKAGFKGMSLANNHSWDLGRAAWETTAGLLAQNGITPLKYEDSPQFVRLEGLTVGLVSLSLVPGGNQPVVAPPGTDLRQKLRVAQNLANLVIVYVHWGSEFLDWPEGKQRDAAQWLVRNGADIIIGHHPHLIQRPEVLNGKPVFYSLGNLVFDQKYPSTREGLLADIRIRDNTVSCSALLTQTPAGSVLPVVSGKDSESEKVLSGCTLELRPLLNVGGITIRPKTTPQVESRSGLVLEALHRGKLIWTTRRAGISSLELMKTDTSDETEYVFTLERHFSSMDGEDGLRPCVYAARPEGLVPKWRGTALAWPLLDAALLPGKRGVLCALHRGDSFLVPQPGSKAHRVAAYRWNGFGFSGTSDPELSRECQEVMGDALYIFTFKSPVISILFRMRDFHASLDRHTDR